MDTGGGINIVDQALLTGDEVLEAGNVGRNHVTFLQTSKFVSVLEGGFPVLRQEEASGDASLSCTTKDPPLPTLEEENTAAG
jgi:hypothetical protein